MTKPRAGFTIAALLGAALLLAAWHVLGRPASGRLELRATLTSEGYLSVNSVAFSPDGKTLAAAVWLNRPGGCVKLWDAAVAKEIAAFDNSDSDFAALSPDGKLVAAARGCIEGGCYGSVGVWDVASGKEVGVFKMPEEPYTPPDVPPGGGPEGVINAAFSPDGKTLAAGGKRGTIKLWDVASRKEVATFQGHTGAASVAFSPDGKTLASAGQSDKTLRLWDVKGKGVALLKGPTSDVRGMAFSPDGQTLAASCGDKAIRLWDVAGGEVRATLRGHEDCVLSVAFSPDGKTLASGSGDGVIGLWEAANGKNLVLFRGHKGAADTSNPLFRVCSKINWSSCYCIIGGIVRQQLHVSYLGPRTDSP